MIPNRSMSFTMDAKVVLACVDTILKGEYDSISHHTSLIYKAVRASNTVTGEVKVCISVKLIPTRKSIKIETSFEGVGTSEDHCVVVCYCQKNRTRMSKLCKEIMTVMNALVTRTGDDLIRFLARKSRSISPGTGIWKSIPVELFKSILEFDYLRHEVCSGEDYLRKAISGWGHMYGKNWVFTETISEFHSSGRRWPVPSAPVEVVFGDEDPPSYA